MARTRNASAIMIDKNGAWISPAAAFLQKSPNLASNVVLSGPGSEPVPEPRPIVGWRANQASWSKNMEAYELACLIDIVLKDRGGFVIELSQEDYHKLPADAQRHFMPIRNEVPQEVVEKVPEKVPEKV